MHVKDSKVLVLGGSGLVGMAVCRELLARQAGEVRIHSLREDENVEAKAELESEFTDASITTSHGDVFSLAHDADRMEQIWAQVGRLDAERLRTFRLYQLLDEFKPDILVDCVNTATAIAYRDIYTAAESFWQNLAEGHLDEESGQSLLETLYVPRLIRHIKVLFLGMKDAGTSVYVKVGTTGTGGMGFNVPYTHSEDKPSQILLSKSAVAGAHSMLLFLMARTPGAPVTKEIKPAAAIAWKKIAYGEIRRHGRPVELVEAAPADIGSTLSSHDPDAAQGTGRTLETVFIDTGENGVFGLEEFALLTSASQMEFVTPEEIAKYLIYEIEGGTTGRDVVSALDGAVLGPTYRAGMQRRWALEQMIDLEAEHDTRSVGFMMLGPPRNTKLLMEAHLLREAFETMEAARAASPEEIAERLDRLVRERPELASQVISVGVPILLASGQLIRGREIAIPAAVEDEVVTPAKIDHWVEHGWVDLRLPNCERWSRRFQSIQDEIESVPDDDTSSRHIRNRRFWQEGVLQPGKLVGWILSVEEHGERMKR